MSVDVLSCRRGARLSKLLKSVLHKRNMLTCQMEVEITFKNRPDGGKHQLNPWCLATPQIAN
jgi:hypothetical protein